MSKQLAFNLPLKSSQGREDFFVAPANALAAATLDAPGCWPDGRMLLTGPPGAGKSHLAQIWADENQALIIPARELTAQTAPDIVARGAAVIEDAHDAAGHDTHEAALFHLYNLCQAEGALLLVTANRPPRDWGLILPDLRSRMDATASVTITPPDDTLLAAVLVKLFADRQLSVPPALIGWLVTRMDRSLAMTRALVGALDHAALAEKRAITRSLAASVLDRLTQDPQE